MKSRFECCFQLAVGIVFLMMAVLAGRETVSAQIVLPHVFVPDTPAKADEVNANFKAVTDGINANAAALSSQTPNAAPAPTGPRLMMTSAEPDLSSLNNPTLLITGENFSSTDSFTGSVFLYVPMQGKVSLNILGFDLAKQEILAGLPVGIEATPGTMRLRVESGAQFNEGVVAIGAVGPKGETGDTGPTGETGTKGEQGAQGLSGPQGDPGPVGPGGTTGVSGPKGNTGAPGPTGLAGPKGVTGASGAVGPTGPKGNTGVTGPIGPKGDQGNTGGTGAQGPKGDIGFTGPMGPMGASPFGLNGLDAFYDTGRVGIGTMTPDAALEVQSDDTDHTSIRIRNTKTSDGIYELRSIQTSGPVNNGFGIWGGMEGFEDYRLIITKDGKIGIGFLDPKTKLSVNGTLSAKAFASLSPLIFEAPAGVERMRINDITGEVSVGGVPVIDAGGNWVGPSSAITGTKGDTGVAGATGPKGDTGVAGATGPKGDTGAAGAAGPKGDAGAAGVAGPKGDAGTAGVAGPKGDAGAAGVAGPKGDAGTAGVAGPKGDAGTAGAAGPKGDAGAAGPKGDAGAAGAAGPKGDAGAAGAAGPKGDKGDTGAQGPAGTGGGWTDDGTVVRLGTATDKVGIGTTTPGEQLEITGNFSLPATTATTGIIKSGGVPFIHSFGPSNFFAGVNAGNMMMTGFANTGSGENALRANITGHSNTAYGERTLQDTTGHSNTAIGAAALWQNTSGNNNTAIGSASFLTNIFDGNNNTAIGAESMTQFLGNGNNNTAVGYRAKISQSSGQVNNATAIGANAIASLSDSLILGGTGSFAVNVGINTITPTERLDVNGCIKHNNGTLGTGCSSDRRLKHEIKPLLFSEVLEKISGLSPVTYRFNSEGDAGNVYLGLIAQEVQEVAPELVGQKENGFLTLDYESIKWMTLQAVKELKAENDALKARLVRLETLLGVAE